MDLAIDAKVLRNRALQARGRWLLGGALVVVLLILFREWLAPSLSPSEIRTARVERGPVSTEVQAAGTIVPVNERVLISPITSSIAEVYLPLGSTVHTGDPILKVDSTQVETALARLADQLRLKDLEIEGLKQQQQRALQELHNREALAQVDLANQKVIVERYDTLIEANVVSRFDYDTARLNAQKTELQLQQLAQQVADTITADTNALEQRAVERQLLAQQLAEQETLLHDATLRASSNGIITVLMSDIGQNVAAGAELARISDLSSYRVDATLSDFYLHQISVGMLVTLDLGNGSLGGHLEQILPAVDNGTIRLRITLDEPGNAQLKPNLRVEAGIVTDSRHEGLRVTNGVVFNGAGLQNVFVVQNAVAVKRQVEVGLSNSDHVEIVRGLAEGDEIIISDMTEYQHLDKVGIDN
jgi:HlyD family secretion protein